MSRKPIPTRLTDAYRESAQSTDGLIGNDLTPSMLDELWRLFTGSHPRSTVASWWADKPHQIGYRLLLRLTRAELEVETLRAELKSLKGSDTSQGTETP